MSALQTIQQVMQFNTEREPHIKPKTVTFQYIKKAGMVETRTVVPFLIEGDLMKGHDTTKQALRAFTISSISNISITD